jgi:hypothetical protein
MQRGDLNASNDAFLNGGPRRVHGVLAAILLLLDLDLGRAADTDRHDAAREFCQTLSQLLLVVVGGRLLDLRLDLRDPPLDVGFLAGASRRGLRVRGPVS